MEISVCGTAIRFVPMHLLLYCCIAAACRGWVGWCVGGCTDTAPRFVPTHQLLYCCSASWVGTLVRRFFVRCTVPALAFCCTAVVLLHTHTWWVRGLLVVDGFFCCVQLCFTAVLRTAVLLFVAQGCGWVDRFVLAFCCAAVVLLHTHT